MIRKEENIDLKKFKGYLAILNEENILYKKEDAIQGLLDLYNKEKEKNKAIEELSKNIIYKFEKQSKVIDKMAEYIQFLCSGVESARDNLDTENYSKEGITQYFYRKVENENENND